MRRASTQLILGFLQIAGATFSFYFLLTTGPSRHTQAGVAATALVTLLSLFLNRVVWKPPPEEQKKSLAPLNHGHTRRH